MGCARHAKKGTVFEKSDNVIKTKPSINNHTSVNNCCGSNVTVNSNNPVYNCRNDVLNTKSCSTKSSQNPNQISIFHQWKFGTLNTRSREEKLEGARMYAITKEVGRANLSFCCLQEISQRITGKKFGRLKKSSGYSYSI